ncbi:MAG: hypothetical protein OIF50_02335 [Flavobacteriaceae bacterium]|nr:hypothetical protein [Flavobacteriaceae bacterium]
MKNLNEFGVKGLNSPEMLEINGGGKKPRRSIWGILGDLVVEYIKYAQSDKCPAQYDNHEDVGGMGFPICA